ncbi:MAG: ATP-binding cassette domain-containing protein [Pseudolabrys sp.]|nr:ATP-binding cassette domain-containing protein [Pseudolabrys sp.]
MTAQTVPAPKHVIDIEAVTMAFGGLTALRDVSFSVFENETVSLIGPNGAGKTTLLNVIAGNLRPSSGRVVLRGEPIQGLPPNEINARGIGRTFQSVEIFATLTVLENAMTGGVAATAIGLAPSFLPWGKARRVHDDLARRARETLDFVGLSAAADMPGGTLPTGQQRLLGIARVMMSGARVLLLDEPGAGLNETEKSALINVISRLSDKGYTIIVVEHDMALVAQVSDRIVVLDQGRLIADGLPDAVKHDPVVIQAYLGRSHDHGVARLRTQVARSEKLLEIDHLSIRYGGVTALDNANVHVNKGEIVALVGPNGAGKSSLVKAVAGFVKPATGTIRYDGADLRALRSPDAVTRKGVSLVPEGRALFPSLTITDNLALGYYTERFRNWGLRGLVAPGLNRNDAFEERKEIAFRLFPILRERQQQQAGMLSGGQAQMLAIARSLMSNPRLLLLDEPSLGLAPKVIDEILHKLLELRAGGLSILLIEQNAQAALQIADRAYVLSTGRIVADGAADAILADPNIASAYLGWDESKPQAETLRSAVS